MATVTQLPLVIKLRDLETGFIYRNLSRESRHRYAYQTILDAIAYWKTHNLRYNRVAGQTSAHGHLSNYCHKQDIPVYTSVDEVVTWEFSSEIFNSCSRVSRGLSM